MTTRREILQCALGLAVVPAALLLREEDIARVVAVAPEEEREQVAARLGPPRPPAGHWLLELHYHSGQTRTEVVGVDHAEPCEHCTVQSINVTTDEDASWMGERPMDEHYVLGADSMFYRRPLRYQVQLRHLDGHLEIVNQPDLVKGTIYQAPVGAVYETSA